MRRKGAIMQKEWLLKDVGYREMRIGELNHDLETENYHGRDRRFVELQIEGFQKLVDRDKARLAELESKD
jgi:hypothetical protein